MYLGKWDLKTEQQTICKYPIVVIIFEGYTITHWGPFPFNLVVSLSSFYNDIKWDLDKTRLNSVCQLIKI